MQVSTILIWFIFSTYTVLWITCAGRAYAYGFFSIGAFLTQVTIKTFLIFVKIELFIILAYWTLELRLATQVLVTGQVIIIGFD